MRRLRKKQDKMKPKVFNPHFGLEKVQNWIKTSNKIEKQLFNTNSNSKLTRMLKSKQRYLQSSQANVSNQNNSATSSNTNSSAGTKTTSTTGTKTASSDEDNRTPQQITGVNDPNISYSIYFIPKVCNVVVNRPGDEANKSSNLCGPNGYYKGLTTMKNAIMNLNDEFKKINKFLPKEKYNKTMKMLLCDIAPGFIEAMKYGRRKMVQNFANFEETERSMIANTGYFVENIKKFAQASLATASDAQKAKINDKTNGIFKTIKDLEWAVNYQKEAMKNYYVTNGKIGLYKGQVSVHDKLDEVRKQSDQNDWVSIQKAAFFDLKRRKIHNETQKLKKKLVTYNQQIMKAKNFLTQLLALLVSTTLWVDPKLHESVAAIRAENVKTDNEYMVRYTK